MDLRGTIVIGLRVKKQKFFYLVYRMPQSHGVKLRKKWSIQCTESMEKLEMFGKFRRKLTRFFVLAFKSITMYNTLYIKCLSM